MSKKRSVRLLILDELRKAAGQPITSNALADRLMSDNAMTRWDASAVVRASVHRLRKQGYFIPATGRGYVLGQSS